MEEFKYLIPEESIDAIMSNVSTLRRIENNLRGVFTKNKYLEVLMPSFEYADLYNNMDIGIEEEKMFQYINYEGKRVALRTDFTVPLARLYSSQNEQGEKRYCYFGKVYRKEKRHKGRSSEFFQAGVELLGKGGFVGEIECLNIIQQSISLLELKDVKIEISSAKFYNRLCELVDDESFVKILKRRDISSMERLVNKKDIQSPLKELLLALPQSFGGIEIVDKMITQINDDLLKEALVELKDLYGRLEMKDIFSFDLAMTPNMKYYTGIIIKGYSPYSASPIINGGRYDKLMNHFQKDVPAIGFSYDLSNILKAIEREEEDNA
ncbi:MAG: ATP phosphoribosyltransferase regulatory subunit [Erysipelotrichales bacterium]|nr:ATP phosphoribosyltransferase regulatory subunit [Erysipelotrichales bacterium]